MPVLRRTHAPDAPVDNDQTGLTALSSYPESSRDRSTLITEQSTGSLSLFRLKWTKTRVTVLITAACLLAILYLSMLKKKPEIVLQQIKTLWHQGADPNAIRQHIGRIHYFVRTNSHGNFPRHTHFTDSDSWVFVQLTSEGYKVYLISMYTLGNTVVDVDTQSEILKSVTLWDYIQYCVTDKRDMITQKMTLRPKSPH
jgi:hypothetical protein